MTRLERPDAGAEARTAGVSDDAEPSATDLPAATAAARRLVALLEQLPALASHDRVATLLAEEVADALDAATVGVWQLPADEGAGAVCLGGVGLTSVHAQTALPVDHPAIEDALRDHGVVVDQTTADPVRVAGLPRLREPILLLVPIVGTPWDDLLVIAGLDTLVPEGFHQVESTVAASADVLALSAWLGRLADLLGDA